MGDPARPALARGARRLRRGGALLLARSRCATRSCSPRSLLALLRSSRRSRSRSASATRVDRRALPGDHATRPRLDRPRRRRRARTSPRSGRAAVDWLHDRAENEFFNRSRRRGLLPRATRCPAGSRQTLRRRRTTAPTGGRPVRRAVRARRRLACPCVGRVVARDETKGMRVVRAGRSPSRLALRDRRALRRRLVGAERVHLPALRLRRRHAARCGSRSDPNLVRTRPARVARPAARRVAPPRSVRRAVEDGRSARAARAPRTASATSRFAVTPSAVPGGGDTRRLGARVNGFRLPAVRIVFDVVAARRTRGRASATTCAARCAALAGGGRAGGRGRRVRADEPARAPRDPATRSTACRSSDACSSSPFAHRWRTALEPPRPAAGRALRSAASTSSTSPTGCTRRSAAALRSTMIHDLVPLRFPEWTTARTRRDARREVPQRGAHVRRRLHQLALHRRRRARAARRRERAAARRAARASTRCSAPRASAADLGRPYVLTVATLEPRKNLDTLVRAHRLLGGELALAVVGGAGWGEQPELDAAGVVRLGYRRRRAARRALPRRRGVRLPVAVRGLRDPDRRGDGERRRRSSRRRTRRSTRRAATRRCAPIPTSPEALARGDRAGGRERDELVAARARARARRSRGSASAETFLDGVP